MEDQQYIKAFNNGYILSKYSPDLITSLKASPDASNEYLQGILSGAKQYEKDMAKERHPTQDIDKAPDKDSKSPDKGIGRDHD